MANILVVDDEAEIVELIGVYLQNAGHNPMSFGDPRAALKAELELVDLAILDVMMPGMDGFALCRELRGRGHTFPIIMLTAKDSDGDKINGLVLGADDYMVKPFNPLELVARVTAQLRRSREYAPAEPDQEEGAGAAVMDVNGLVLDEAAHTCTLYGKALSLTPTEFAILLELCRHRGKVLSSERIFETVWGEESYEGNNTVMVHIQKLRVKLGDTGKKKKFIQTVWGVGYKIEE